MMPFQRLNKGTQGGGAAFYGNFDRDGVANTAMTAGTLRASLIELPEGGTPTTFQIEVQTNGAGSTARLGLYTVKQFDGNLYPDQLIAGTDVGTLDTSTATGVKTNTITGVKLDAGLYFVAFNCSATAPTMVCVGLAAQKAYLGVSATNVIQTGITATLAMAAMPQTFTSGGTYTTTAVHPRVGITFSV